VIRFGFNQLPTSGDVMPVVLLVKANVTSYDHWRTAYDAGASFRRKNGVSRDEVYCSPEDMTSVLVLHFFATVEVAQSFASNPGFAEAMRSSGVIGDAHLTIAQTV
jgi:hypothetical protein